MEARIDKNMQTGTILLYDTHVISLSNKVITKRSFVPYFSLTLRFSRICIKDMLIVCVGQPIIAVGCTKFVSSRLATCG